MNNKVYQCAEGRILATKAFYTFFAIVAPLTFYLAITSFNVTFDNAVVMLIAMLTLLVLFITYHEGKVAINTLRKLRLVMNEEHLLHIDDRKREMILYGDIECVRVVKGFTGRVKRLNIITPYRQMSIEGYESLDQLVNYLEMDKGIVIKS